MSRTTKSNAKDWMVGLVAVIATVVVAGAIAFGQVRQPKGSVYGPYYNPHIMNNGTGTLPDSERDPHNDR